MNFRYEREFATCANIECTNPVENHDTGLCASCGKLQRDAEKRAKKDAEKLALKLSKKREPRAKPRPISKKREVINQEYFRLVEQFKKDNPECKAKINEYCTEKTDDPHHSRGRGKYLLDVSTWIPVCRACHRYITDHPSDSQKRGLSFSRLSTNKTI